MFNRTCYKQSVSLDKPPIGLIFMFWYSMP